MTVKKTYDIIKDGHPYIEGIEGEVDARRLYKVIWDTYRPRVLKLQVNEIRTHTLIDNNQAIVHPST